MPTVEGKKFAYTKEGKEKAKKYAKKTGKKVKSTYAKKGRYIQFKRRRVLQMEGGING